MPHEQNDKHEIAAMLKQIDEIIDRYVVERENRRGDASYPTRELFLRFGMTDLDAIELGRPGVSVGARRTLVATVLRDFAWEVLGAAGITCDEPENTTA